MSRPACRVNCIRRTTIANGWQSDVVRKELQYKEHKDLDKVREEQQHAKRSFFVSFVRTLVYFVFKPPRTNNPEEHMFHAKPLSPQRISNTKNTKIRTKFTKNNTMQTATLCNEKPLCPLLCLSVLCVQALFSNTKNTKICTKYAKTTQRKEHSVFFVMPLCSLC